MEELEFLETENQKREENAEKKRQLKRKQKKKESKEIGRFLSTFEQQEGHVSCLFVGPSQQNTIPSKRNHSNLSKPKN